MFDVGFQEIVLVSIIGLLVLGPQRLPKVAAEIGKWVGRARRTATQLRRQLEREIELSELETPPPRPPPSRRRRHSAAAAGAPQRSPAKYRRVPARTPTNPMPLRHRLRLPVRRSSAPSRPRRVDEPAARQARAGGATRGRDAHVPPPRAALADHESSARRDRRVAGPHAVHERACSSTYPNRCARRCPRARR